MIKLKFIITDRDMEKKMRQYKEVVKERYNKLDFSSKGLLSDIYSLINPVGYYGAIHSMDILKDFVRLLSETHNLDSINLLDAGCGNGFNTRIMAELIGTGERVYGFDYSENEIDFCKRMNPIINYKHMDICDFEYGIKMDGITAFDCISHLRKEKEVIAALSRVFECLDDNGLFMWYDINASSHFVEDENDTRGFSTKEMDEYAAKVGFCLVKEHRLYKTVPYFNTSTYYFATRFKVLTLQILDKILPTKQTINVRIYKKHYEFDH